MVCENDLDDLQLQRALVEDELRRQAKAPPGLKIRDLLASRSTITDEDDEEDDENENEEIKDERKLKNEINSAQIKLV